MSSTKFSIGTTVHTAMHTAVLVYSIYGSVPVHILNLVTWYLYSAVLNLVLNLVPVVGTQSRACAAVAVYLILVGTGYLPILHTK